MLEPRPVLVFWCPVNIKKLRTINIGINNIKRHVLHFHSFDVALYPWHP